MKEKLSRLKALGQRTAAKVATTAMLSAGAVSAFAQEAGGDTFDGASFAAKIVATIAGILVVSGAVFSVHVALKSGKWARRAL